MLIQFDQYRSIELEPTEQWRCFVIQGNLFNNEVKLISKHRTERAAIAAARRLQGTMVRVVIYGTAYPLAAFERSRAW